jgi:PAS domain S-box-containing protein
MDPGPPSFVVLLMPAEDEPSVHALSISRVAELIVEHAGEYAILTMDLHGKISTWSPGAERITGYTAKEAVGMDFSRLFSASDRSAGQERVEIERAWREGRYEDSRWHLRKNGERFWANGMTMALRDSNVEGLIKIFRDETRSRLAEEQRVLLLNELNHRINNTLVTVQSLVEQTLRTAEIDPTVRANLVERLLALSEAHKVLVEQNWAGADLRSIVKKALTPYDQGGGRMRLDGPPLRLSPQQAVQMSLVLHELATNAVKYGALSTLDGQILVSWNQHLSNLGERIMTFLWEERGGPPVVAPTRRGFGSRLIARTLGAENEQAARIDFAPSGVRCSITLPLSSKAEVQILDPADRPNNGDG